MGNAPPVISDGPFRSVVVILFIVHSSGKINHARHTEHDSQGHLIKYANSADNHGEGRGGDEV